VSKRIVTIICLGFILVLTGCGRRETVTVCEFDDAFLPIIGWTHGSETITIEATGDYVDVVEMVVRFDLDEFLDLFDIDESEIASLWQVLMDEADLIGYVERSVYEAINAMTMELYEVNANYVVIRKITNYSEMSSADMMIYLEDYQRGDFISLELIIGNLESEGAVCVVQ